MASGEFVASLFSSFIGTGGAMWIALRWLRADVDRAHARLDEHTQRLRALELKPSRSK